MENDKRASKELVTQVSTDIFLIKEKLNDMEFKQILEHIQALFNKLDKDSKLVVELLNRLENLKMKYMKLAETNEVLLRMFHEEEYHNSCNEHFVQH